MNRWKKRAAQAFRESYFIVFLSRRKGTDLMLPKSIFAAVDALYGEHTMR
jgi:hypothetical protein